MVKLWNELGIEPTRDEKAIRRAYAQRLKSIGSDADAFKVLRAAYEGALQEVRYDRWQAEQAANDGSITCNGTVVSESEAATESVLVPVPPTPMAQMWGEIGVLVEGGQTLAAMNVLKRGLAQGIVPLGHREYMIEHVMAAAMDNPATPPDDFLALLDAAGWNHKAATVDVWSPTLQAALDRGDCEAWYKRLVKLAESSSPEWYHGDWNFLDGDIDVQMRRNARRLLQPCLPFIHVSGTAAEHLRTLTAWYRTHEKWLAPRIPPQNIRRAEIYSKISNKLGKVALAIGIFVGSLLALGAVIGSGGSAGIFILLFWIARGLRAAAAKR